MQCHFLSYLENKGQKHLFNHQVGGEYKINYDKHINDNNNTLQTIRSGP